MNNTTNKYKVLSEIFKSIAHPERLAIIQLMCNCGCNRLKVKSIYDELNLEQPIVSRHLRIMRQSGLLRREQEGNSTYYGLCDENEAVSCIIKCFKK